MSHPIAIVLVYKNDDGTLSTTSEASGYCRMSPASPLTPGYPDFASALAAAAEKLDEHAQRTMPEGTAPIALPDFSFETKERP